MKLKLRLRMRIVKIRQSSKKRRSRRYSLQQALILLNTSFLPTSKKIPFKIKLVEHRKYCRPIFSRQP